MEPIEVMPGKRKGSVWGVFDNSSTSSEGWQWDGKDRQKEGSGGGASGTLVKKKSGRIFLIERRAQPIIRRREKKGGRGRDRYEGRGGD